MKTQLIFMCEEPLLKEGTEIGACRIVRLVGRGGMGEVYEAEHVRLGVPYAVKVFPIEGRDATFLAKRFRAEGRLLARLNHPRIVRVYDMGQTDRFAWFSMDYVTDPDGRPRTLADAPCAGLLPEKTLIGWYGDMREALAAIHAAGVVHRDVKLENMLVGKDGRAVLSDFGVSRIVDERLRESVAVTRTIVSADAGEKAVLGTVAYLAPEVRAGASPSPASDHYALGVAFFRLLTGLWYEPGPHAFDLLAPYDRRWRTILGELLAVDPNRRQAKPFPVSRPSRGWIWKGLLVLSLVLWAALAALVGAFPRNAPFPPSVGAFPRNAPFPPSVGAFPRNAPSDTPSSDSGEDEFSIPASLR